MIIREAEKEDIDSICELLSMLFEQEAEFKPDFETHLKGVREIVTHSKNGKFFVMEDSGEIVGIVSLLFLVSTALGGNVALLEDLVLAKHVRRQGFGTKLLEFAVKYAQDNECMRITVLTDKDNLAAQSLYQKVGFQYSKMIPMRLML